MTTASATAPTTVSLRDLKELLMVSSSHIANMIRECREFQLVTADMFRDLGIDGSLKKPPAREKAPYDPLLDACICEVFGREVGKGEDYVRRWFTKHRDGTYVDGHAETLTTGKYVSIRILPEGRRLFFEAHRPKLLRLA